MTSTPATEAQVKFVTALAESRALTEKQVELFAIVSKSGYSKNEASLIIESFKAMPYKARPNVAPERNELQDALRTIPKSKYAVEFSELGSFFPNIASNGNDLLFLEVREFKGSVYMRRLHGAPGGFSRSRLSRADTIALAKVIARDAVAAVQRFGRHYSVCGCCGADLTDSLSRELNLGPECRKRFGF